MYLYLLPPVWLVVLALAYVFQMRVGELRAVDGSEDAWAVRVVRGLAHASAVVCIGFVSPFASALTVNAVLAADRSRLVLQPLLWAGMLACFAVGVTVSDKLADSVLAFMVARRRPVARSTIPTRDLLRLELPDIALLVVLLFVSLCRA